MAMDIVEFKITDVGRESEGILEIARRMRVTCLEGERFVVAENGLIILDQLGISYRVLTKTTQGLIDPI